MLISLRSWGRFSTIRQLSTNTHFTNSTLSLFSNFMSPVRNLMPNSYARAYKQYLQSYPSSISSITFCVDLFNFSEPKAFLSSLLSLPITRSFTFLFGIMLFENHARGDFQWGIIPRPLGRDFQVQKSACRGEDCKYPDF